MRFWKATASGRCATCRNWSSEPSGAWHSTIAHMGECAAVPMREDAEHHAVVGGGGGAWSGSTGEAAVQVAMRGTPAVVVDEHGYFAALRTARDFGCVLHRPHD